MRGQLSFDLLLGVFLLYLLFSYIDAGASLTREHLINASVDILCSHLSLEQNLYATFLKENNVPIREKSIEDGILSLRIGERSIEGNLLGLPFACPVGP